MRLAGGSQSNEGRVELCISGQWKTVCGNSWSSNEARVVCRELGHAYQGNKTLSHQIIIIVVYKIGMHGSAMV